MPKTQRVYNKSNLTYGGRTLRVTMQLSNESLVEKAIMDVAQNFSKSVRNEVMNDAYAMLIRNAKRYIREGKREALTPNPADNTHNLERDLSKNIRSDERDYIRVDLSHIPYAALHNKPLGTYTLIGQGKRMVFYWHRKGRWISTTSGVKKPGLGFLDRATEDVRKAMPGLIKKYIAHYRAHGYAEIAPKTGAQLRGPSRSAAGRRNARMGK